MVDFRITTPQDNVELSFDLNNNVKTNANHVNASTDSILGLAQSTGMIEAANQINQDSAAADRPVSDQDDLQTQESEEQEQTQEEESARKRERKNRRDSRSDEGYRQAAKIAQERDAYALRLQEMEVELLQKKKDQLDRDVDHITSVMKNAKGIDDTHTFVDANQLLSQLTHEQFKTHESLEQASSAYQESYDAYETPAEYNLYDDSRYQKLLELSHKKELKSEAYHEWLEDNEIFNPFSEDFNPRLAQEFGEAKHAFNDWLQAHGQHSIIGTESYYDELDDLIRIKNQEKYGTPDPEPSSQGGYGQSQHNQYAGEDDMSQPISRASVAPVNRQGYQNPYAGSNSSLPELTESEKRIAEICPMTEVPTIRGVQPRYLSNEEKYAVYQQNKAKMMGMGT